MKRRTYIGTLGTLTITTAGVFASGAFSTVKANRNLDVTVEADESSYLRMGPSSENGQFVTGAADGPMELDFSSTNGDVPGDGFNKNSATGLSEVFEISNQGTQNVEVGFVCPLLDMTLPFALLIQDGAYDQGIWMFITPHGTLDEITLDPGETQTYSVTVLVHEDLPVPDSYSPFNPLVTDHLSINAEATQ